MESNVVYASGPFVSGTSDSTGRGGSFFKLSTYLRVPTNLRVPTSFTKTSRILVANPRRESSSRIRVAVALWSHFWHEFEGGGLSEKLYTRTGGKLEN